MTQLNGTEPRPLETYEECINKAARVYADWLAERAYRLSLAATKD